MVQNIFLTEKLLSTSPFSGLYLRRAVLLAVAMFATLAALASPLTNRPATRLVLTSLSYPALRDTDTVADSIISERNAVFKQRLDAIQKTVPLTYNTYVQEYIDIYMSRQGQIGKMLGLSQYYFPIYDKAFQENDVPAEIKFLSIVESSLDPQAVSRSGATGLWQFMTTTAKDYGLSIDSYSDQRKDPVAASTAASKYLKESFVEFGDWLLAIASYNCGTGAVSRAIVKAGGVKDFWAIRDYLPQQTQNYVPAFIATNYIMNYYDSHNISAAKTDLPAETSVIQVNRFVSLESVANAIDVDVQKLYLLNPAYKKKIVNGTADAPKSLVIPVFDRRMYSGLYNALNTEQVPVIAETKTTPISKHSRSSHAVYHKVKKGENLSTIANRYGVEVLDLKEWNKLKNLLIKPGQLLKVSADKHV